MGFLLLKLWIISSSQSSYIDIGRLANDWNNSLLFHIETILQQKKVDDKKSKTSNEYELHMHQHNLSFWFTQQPMIFFVWICDHDLSHSQICSLLDANISSFLSLSPPFSLTTKGYYLPPSQMLPLLSRSLHSGLTYTRDLWKTKFTIYITWESLMYR